MITSNPIYNDMFNRAAREIVGRVELLEGSTLLQIFEHNGALQSFTVERIGDNTRFFGYGVCQEITVNLRDKDRQINIQKGQRLQAAFGVGTDYIYTCPIYLIDEVTRDENTNNLTIRAYDPMYKANSHRSKELDLPDTYTLKTFAYACGTLLGMPVNFIGIPDSLLNIQCSKSNVNLDGEESIRELLDDLAELFGAVYYFCNNWQLTFKGLDASGEPVAAIDKSKYFELSAKTAHTLTNLASVTELSENISTSSGITGETQYFRENVFLTLRDDVGSILQTVLNAVQGLTFHQFECKHRGDFRLEIGDKISFETKDGNLVNSFVLNDKLTYHGGLEGETTLEYAFNEAEAETAPSTLGDALKQTYAKVDKVNQTITLMANDMDERIASLVLTTNQIQSTVTNNKENLESQITQTAGSISSIVTDEINKAKTEIKQTTDSITLAVQSQEQETAQLRLDVDGIDARGYVTVTDLAGTGTTTINGSNITTGTIAADRINMTGAISWGDLTQSCQNTIASYAGADGADAVLPDYIHSTYIDSARIVSPTIQGGTISAGTTATGYMTMSDTGMTFVDEDGKENFFVGYYPGFYNLPYLLLGGGRGSGLDRGMVKKYEAGIWIGDNDAENEDWPSGTGIFINFNQGKIFHYINGVGTEVTAAPAAPIDDGSSSTSHGIWTPRLSNETPVTGVTTRRGWYSTTGYITTIGFYLKMNVAANNNTIPIAITDCPFIPANVCSGGGIAKNVFTAAGLVFTGWNMNTSGTIQPALYNGSHSGGDITTTNAMYFPRDGGAIELSGTIILNT